MSRKIITKNVYPPIPCRQFDWCAYAEDDVEDGHYGWGATEEEALEDYIATWDDRPFDIEGLFGLAGGRFKSHWDGRAVPPSDADGFRTEIRENGTHLADSHREVEPRSVPRPSGDEPLRLIKGGKP